MNRSKNVVVDEDRILRVWTPRVLRGALAASVILLVAGLCLIGATEPDSYVHRFRELGNAHAEVSSERPSELLRGAWSGPGRAIILCGLLMLTLVPIARVAFCMVVFLRTRDRTFAVLTGLVLALLCLGVFLGRVG
jgi:uncharacterized membrane protein